MIWYDFEDNEILDSKYSYERPSIDVCKSMHSWLHQMDILGI